TGESSAVVVAGTFAEVRGGEGALAGAGIAFDDASVEVPILGRVPGAVAPATPLWAPDVAVTLARFAGVELPGAVGADLRGTQDAQRILFAETR
ncbi:MAG: hypothetical protein GWO04_08485, partial [Actinobacteria bacterium]|nr:hypothetical protein [Actinomycetota bacterium]